MIQKRCFAFLLLSLTGGFPLQNGTHLLFRGFMVHTKGRQNLGSYCLFILEQRQEKMARPDKLTLHFLCLVRGNLQYLLCTGGKRNLAHCHRPTR